MGERIMILGANRGDESVTESSSINENALVEPEPVATAEKG